MGLYDHIKCLYPLPTDIPNINERIFQTKSINPCLRYFEISQYGLLQLENNVENKKELIPFLFSGNIKFYTFYDEEVNEGWIEFLATFKNGKIIDEIKIIEVTKK